MKLKINTRLLPIKANFFFFWGGMAGVMPFLTVIAQNLGISASAVGIIAIIFPFVSVFAKPLFGSAADRFRKLKLMMLAFIPIIIATYFGINYISHIERRSIENVLLCSNQGPELGIPLEWFSDCCASLEESNTTSDIQASCSMCKLSYPQTQTDYSNVTSDEMNCESEIKSFHFSLNNEYVKRNRINVWFPLLNLTSDEIVNCETPQLFKCVTKFPHPHDRVCHITRPISESIYQTSQFWLFFTLFILSRTFSSVLISFSDTACFDLLEGQYHKYGKQRLFGALGWGICSLINTYVTSLFPMNGGTNFSIGFYMMTICLGINFIVIFFIDIRSSHSSGKIAKNVGKVLRDGQVLVFLAGVLAMGILTGIYWTYYFWFLNTLHATTWHFGAVLVVQCFLGEIPFFFIAGWLINKIGNRNALSLSLGAFGFRFLAYSYVTDPWYAVPIELTQGLTFGIFYTLMTTYAKAVTPPGTEATIQGLVGGTFEGLGMAIAGLAGFGFDQLGQRTTFRITALFALVCCVLHIIAHLVYRFSNLRTSNGAEPLPAVRNDEETSFLPDNGPSTATRN